MKHLPFWIVSWAASAVLLAPLFGWERPEHALAAVNVYTWFMSTLFVIAALCTFSKKAREPAKAIAAKRNVISKAIGVVTSLTFIGATAYVGWIGRFGTLLVCWLLTTAQTAAD